ncbi:hypothetical protein [Streptomyces sp. NPDC047985]|uniref:hypothetical protein n=1 Tax=Streptomyces sp. NPDC047985 TaxID=3155384 RepID=UPI003449D6BA
MNQRMTRQEFVQKQHRLFNDIEDARKALVCAETRFNGLLEKARLLRYDWREQQRQDGVVEL